MVLVRGVMAVSGMAMSSGAVVRRAAMVGAARVMASHVDPAMGGFRGIGRERRRLRLRLNLAGRRRRRLLRSRWRAEKRESQRRARKSDKPHDDFPFPSRCVVAG